MPPRKTITTSQYDEIKESLHRIENTLSERKHIDDKVKIHEELLEGNGKPGFKQVRDKVQAWESKINAIILLVLGDVVLRVLAWVFQNPQ